MGMARVIAGFALAPLPVLSLPALVAWEFTDAELLLQSMLIGYGATLLVGVPVHLFLESRSKRALTDYVAVTAYAVVLAGFLAAACDSLIFGSGGGNRLGLTMWSMLGVAGLLLVMAPACFTACMFWWIAVRRKFEVTGER